MKTVYNTQRIEFMPYDYGNKVAEEFFESLFSKYQTDLETSMRKSIFIFNSVQLLYYKCLSQDKFQIR